MFHVPDETRALQNLLWRSYDCRRNSITNLARVHFSPRRLHRLNNRRVLDLLLQEKQIDWNGTCKEHSALFLPPSSVSSADRPPADLPEAYKYGLLVKRKQFVKRAIDPISKSEVDALRGVVVQASMHLLWDQERMEENVRLIFSKYINQHPLEDRFTEIYDASSSPSLLPPESEAADD